MANFYLSPIGNGAQFFTVGGLPLNSGYIYTYAAGTSTPLATYTTPIGNIANPVQIQLGVDGRPPNEIWFSQGDTYKFVLLDSLLNIIATYDNLAGINDPTANSIASEWIPVIDTPTYVSATQFTMVGNQTLLFEPDRRIQVFVSAGTLYGYVSSASFSVGVTTVNVVMDSGALDSGLSQVNIGIINSVNTSLPQIPLWVKSSMLQDDSVIARALNDSTLGYALINGTIAASVATSALTIAIKTKAGTDPSVTDPVLVYFRSATLTSGVYNVRSVIAATSIVIPSTATLGTISTVLSQIDVLVIDNVGTVELAVVNHAGALSLPETDLITTTTIAGASNSINTIYSTTGRTSVPYRNVGWEQSTQGTAGTWASNPTQIQLVAVPQPNGNQIYYLPEQASTSGTSIDFTGIPSWATKVDVLFVGVSTNGTSDLILQIGPVGGVESSGYLGTANAATAGGNTLTNYTASFGLAVTTAASIHHGIASVYLEDATDNTWIYQSTLSRSDNSTMNFGAGSKPLAGTLTRVRITSAGGANTFDAGVIRVRFS